jgi:hypothetical protein
MTELQEARSTGSFLTGVRRIFPFGRKPAHKPVVAPAAPPPSPKLPPPVAKKPEMTADHEKIRALGFFCGFLTAGAELYADAAAGAEAFAKFTHLAKKPTIRADLHETFAAACLEGAHAPHVREIDEFINALRLPDDELAEQLTHALRCVLALKKQGPGHQTWFAYEIGTARSVDVFKRLLSIVRRAPEAFALLAAPEGGRLNLRGIERRLLEERLDHAEKLKAEPAALESSADVARQLGLSEPYTREAVQAARRRYAASHHPDRAAADKRELATQDLARVNAALDEIAKKLAV